MMTRRNAENALNGRNSRESNERGALMMEAIALLGLMTMMSPMVVRQTADRTAEMEEVAVAGQVKDIKDALSNWIRANYENEAKRMINANKLTDKIAVTASQLARYLPATALDGSNFRGNKLMEGFDIGVRAECVESKMTSGTYAYVAPGTSGSKCSNYKMTGLVLSKSSSEIDDRRAARIASMIGADGGSMRTEKFVNAMGATGAAKTAQMKRILGAQGIWEGNTDDYFASLDTSKGGRVAATTVYSTEKSGDYLYRHKVDGMPDANSMFTNLDMGGAVKCDTIDPSADQSCHMINNAGGLEVVKGRIIIRSQNTTSGDDQTEDATSTKVSLGTDHAFMNVTNYINLASTTNSQMLVNETTAYMKGKASSLTLNNTTAFLNANVSKLTMDQTTATMNVQNGHDTRLNMTKDNIKLSANELLSNGDRMNRTTLLMNRTGSYLNVNDSSKTKKTQFIMNQDTAYLYGNGSVLNLNNSTAYLVGNKAYLNLNATTAQLNGNGALLNLNNSAAYLIGNKAYLNLNATTAQLNGNGSFLNLNDTTAHLNGNKTYLEMNNTTAFLNATKSALNLNQTTAFLNGNGSALNLNNSTAYLVGNKSALTLNNTTAFLNAEKSQLIMNQTAAFLNGNGTFLNMNSSRVHLNGNKTYLEMNSTTAFLNATKSALNLNQTTAFLNGNGSYLNLNNTAAYLNANASQLELNQTTAFLNGNGSMMTLNNKMALMQFNKGNVVWDRSGMRFNLTDANGNVKKVTYLGASKNVEMMNLNVLAGRVSASFFQPEWIMLANGNVSRPVIQHAALSYDNEDLGLTNAKSANEALNGKASGAYVSDAWNANYAYANVNMNTSADSSGQLPYNTHQGDANYKRFRVDPAFTSVMNDIKLTSRGGARLSEALPNYILKGIYILTNSFGSGPWPCTSSETETSNICVGGNCGSCKFYMPKYSLTELGLDSGGWEHRCDSGHPIKNGKGTCANGANNSVEFNYRASVYNECPANKECWAHPYMGRVPAPGYYAKHKNDTIKNSDGNNAGDANSLYASDEGFCPDGYQAILTLTPTMFELGRIVSLNVNASPGKAIMQYNPGYQNYAAANIKDVSPIIQPSTQIGFHTRGVTDSNNKLVAWDIAMGTITSDSAAPGGFRWNVGGIPAYSWQAIAHTYCYFNPARFYMPNMQVKKAYTTDSDSFGTAKDLHNIVPIDNPLLSNTGMY